MPFLDKLLIKGETQKVVYVDRKVDLAPPKTVLYFPGSLRKDHTIYDLSPYVNHGTINGATWVRLPSGLWSLNFDGGDDFISVANSASLLDFTTVCTFLVWFYWDDATNGAAIISRDATFSYFLGAYLGTHATAPRKLTWGKNGSDEILSTIQLSTGQYYCLGVDHNGPTNQIYINGVLDISVGGKGDFAARGTAAMLVGKHTTPAGWWLDGKVALVSAYPTVFSAATHLSFFQQTRHLFGV